ncbi:RluA family pseudouridine synthase [Vibrio aquimaris]|uniref:Ribosomal large subunit pseudouridine synthase A n=1 Tax=Vibrio aquimaris TaxID=2587862 RepID=A0A5P9CR50_9VIBR|nr:RluA family pseudouridine synthase [Vibrio aquimaris]QFT28690.1 Ribosomal large subunit pseudouridine synthase A [Vibrio aquimaris]
MHHSLSLFTLFNACIDEYSLPEKFTFPFFYEPHPLCKLAARELQQYLLTQNEWVHNFGLDNHSDGVGKMFGVLIVKSPQGEIGYLSAFSGKLAGQSKLTGFVPPVFDIFAKQSFFHTENEEIMSINDQIDTLNSGTQLTELASQVEKLESNYKKEESTHRAKMIANRAERKLQRQDAQSHLNGAELERVLDSLAKQSVDDKNTLKYLKLEWQDKIDQVKNEWQKLNHELNQLKDKRKTLSNALQHKLFEQYRFLNILAEEKSLNSIFEGITPPAGAGECAAPKLLHYAFKHGFKPLAMAEFWWGKSPTSEIRQHKTFYPSCHSKCQPILGHMLQGMDVDDNPLEKAWAEHNPMGIVFEDEALVVINKPTGLLSIPGKTIQDSAITRLQKLYPNAEGPFVIHRLDMATSGLLVFALTKRANKSLQKQFITRTVEKRYVAIVQGEVQDQSGQINLPMRGDPDDRPRQLVCFEHGKPAETYWERVEVKEGQSRLYLYPKTGRTHQLRVHCAHHLGLNMPMHGDGLYGQRSKRLHLHAQRLVIEHPYTKERMTFEAESPF